MPIRKTTSVSIMHEVCEGCHCVVVYILLFLLYAQVCFHIVSAQYSAISIEVEFFMWMFAMVQVWFSFHREADAA